MAAFAGNLAMAMQDTTKPVKVAVFIPIYLQDAFQGDTYILEKGSMPKNILPGLEFYNGVLMAIDSLVKEGEKVKINIYDIKQSPMALKAILSSPELSDMGLIIAVFTNTTELKLFADYSSDKTIPLISATYPNFVGISDNPFFVLLNSSFTTHLKGLYKYLQQNHSTNKIIALKKPGATEDYIRNTINNLNKNTPGVPLNIKWVDVSESISPSEIVRHMDSTTQNVFFVASPLESFGVKAVRSISALKNYPSIAIGMPTWASLRELNRSDCSNTDIVYSTPFIYPKSTPFGNYLNDLYKEKFYSRPSDMVFKGFETTYHFTKLLIKHRYNLVNNLSDKDFSPSNKYEIEPVKINNSGFGPDYLENVKLNFIKKREGYVVSIQ